MQEAELTGSRPESLASSSDTTLLTSTGALSFFASQRVWNLCSQEVGKCI